MSLLREIQSAAIDDNVSLVVLLRKCKVLAARLDSLEFKAWIEEELNGYPDIYSLPDYRIYEVNSKGHFVGSFQREIRNADIPLTCIKDKELRENLSKTYFSQPISVLESYLNSAGTTSLHEPWNPDVVAHFAQGIYQDMNCVQAWKVVPIAAMVAALDTVRNRVLNFVLEIEAESPNAGEAEVNSIPLPHEKVQQIFNTNIYGSVQNLATASSEFNQVASNTSVDNQLFDDILAALNKTDTDIHVVEEVCSTVEEMKSNYGLPEFKDSYLSFMTVLSNHMSVFGPVVAPFLPALTALSV